MLTEQSPIQCLKATRKRTISFLGRRNTTCPDKTTGSEQNKRMKQTKAEVVN